MSLKNLAVSKRDLLMIDPRNIEIVEGFNVRRDTEALRNHIRGLADSIKEMGVQMPLTVFYEDGKAKLSDGHNRLMATMLAIEEGAEIVSVPCVVEPRTSNSADRTLSMVIRNQGKSLEPLEEAEVYKRLIGFGWSEAQIAAKVGRSPAHVNNMLELTRAAPEIVGMIDNGEVAATTVIQTLKATDSEKVAAEAIKEAVEEAKANGKKKATGAAVAEKTAEKTGKAPKKGGKKAEEPQGDEAPAQGENAGGAVPAAEGEEKKSNRKPRVDWEFNAKIMFKTMQEALAAVHEGDTALADEILSGSIRNYQDYMD